jgi:glycerophosphoryl diester phosphodiesterase
MTSPQVVAHRGASARAPENTLAAVRLARIEGAESVECDVQRTRDGVLVVLHDPTLSRTTDVQAHFPRRSPWAVADFTLAELRRLDAGRGERVPTLEEWIGAVGPDTGMLVEVKSPGAHPGVAAELVELLSLLPASRAAAGRGLLTVQSFDHGFLREVKQLAPGVRVVALFRRTPRGRQLLDAASWGEGINVRSSAVKRSLVHRAHLLGLTVGVWTVDDEAGFQRALRAGVDVIITNDPARLRGFLPAA